jgi:ABC-2 type transport system permease protein
MTAAAAPARAWPWFRVRAYLGFVNGTFHRMLAYRLRYVTGLVSYLIYVTTYYFLWKAVFDHRAPGATVGGYSLADMVTYVAIGWIARSFYFNNVDREISELVQNGQIALALARPVSFQGTILAGAIGEGAFRVAFFTLPISVVIFLLYPVAPPASPLHALAFLASCLLSLVVLTHLNFLVGLTAFPLKNIDGVLRAKHYLLELLSGLLIPVAMFPPALQELSRWLPFQAVAFVPGQIWLGKLAGTGIARGLLLQAAWAGALAAVSAWTWSRASRRLTVQGG